MQIVISSGRYTGLCVNHVNLILFFAAYGVGCKNAACHAYWDCDAHEAVVYVSAV